MKKMIAGVKLEIKSTTEPQKHLKSVLPLYNSIISLQIITNGKYRSAEHRAITNAKRARLSVATFHDPAKTKTIFPAFEPPLYNQVVYGNYVSSWYTKGPEGKRNVDALLI